MEYNIPLGRFKKQNAMDCGNPKCCLCGNPRKSKKLNKQEYLTLQEKIADIKIEFELKNLD